MLLLVLTHVLALSASSLHAPGAGARVARLPLRASRRCAPLASSAGAASGAQPPPRRVRFLFSDTGGGHRASALALQGAMESMYPGQIECDLVDLFVASKVWPFCEAPAAYRWMAARPIVWKLFFEAGATPLGAWINEVLTDMLCGRRYRELLAARPRPDCVVSVHPLMQGPALRALAANDGGTRTTPFATVVTDLGSAHPKWFHAGVDACFVPSDVLAHVALREGLRPEQVRTRSPRRARGAPRTTRRSRLQRRAALRTRAPAGGAARLAHPQGILARARWPWLQGGRAPLPRTRRERADVPRGRRRRRDG